MFQIKANPTFPATLTIVGQSRKQTLKLVYRHMVKDNVEKLLTDFATEKTPITETVLAVVDSWEADMDLSAESLAVLQQQQPGACEAILAGYSRGLQVAREGN